MKQVIYFTGTLPRKGQTPFGGGEVGNVRTIRMLQSFGHEVFSVKRYKSNAQSGRLQRRFTYPFRTFATVVHWFFILLFGKRRYSIAHISGFYGSTIVVETLQVFIAKLLGYKLIYELRGGGAAAYYENGSKRYRKQFEYILNKADYLFSQGRENEALLHSLCNKPIIYYPNCVQKGFYPETMPNKPTDCLNLLFFGRIEAAKNPELIIDVTSILQKQFNNVRLKMIGNGKSEMIERLRVMMSDKLLAGSYELLPGCAHDELRKKISDQHFYVFPSEQPREGQSNAVTEAMAFGIIPIASPQGFNRSTIGNDYLIVEELSAEAYSNRISEIIRNGKIGQYAQYVRTRFVRNFTEEAVFERMKHEYFNS